MTDPPSSITYASVISRESVRVALLVAALNDLNVMSADIKNAYLSSLCDEKVWTVLGPEFGSEREGKHAKIVQSLYGLKSAGASYRHYLAARAPVPRTGIILLHAWSISGLKAARLTLMCGCDRTRITKAVNSMNMF